MRSSRFIGHGRSVSASGELADAFLVAASSGDLTDPLGMVTISLDGQSGQIGLFAVREDARGRGLGAMLLRAGPPLDARPRGSLCDGRDPARQRRRLPGLRAPGYRLKELRNFYHFWLREGHP